VKELETQQSGENQRAAESVPPPTPTLYFADGYHGGIKGHMALGSWRDILETLRRVPDWKICIDIEPISWTYLRRRDPDSYAELKRLLSDGRVDARVEMVAASFAQPYGWVIGGESNIRHLTRGREVLREHFPGLVVDTYAVQEPCWTSALPQILRSLGYARAVLKDPSTAWAGYTAGFDADVVLWVGPDGSRIPCVPRYACEDLLNAWETESAHATPEFARKCAAHGIARPAGMYFQDCGWPAKPRVRGDHVRYVTWREYVETIAPKPDKEWRFSQEDILCTLPWGEATLQRLARQVRAAENRLLVAEKMAAMAAVLRGLPWPGEKLREAWGQLLLAQHHDAWICARSGGGRRSWAWQVGAETWAAEEICDAVVAASAEALTAEPPRASGSAPSNRGPAPDPESPPSHWVRVFNSLSSDRTDLVEVPLVTAPGAQWGRVFDAAGAEVPAQAAPLRRYGGDNSLNASRIVFAAQAPALGYSTYRCEPALKEPDAAARATGARAVLQESGSAIIDTDLYRIVLDAARGGAVASLYSKALDREFVDAGNPRRFNEYRGYFIEERKWLSSADAPAKLNVIENGPVRVRVAAVGSVAGHPWFSSIALCQGQRRIDFHVSFHFHKDTWIGDPADIAPEEKRVQRTKSHHDGRYKLQALFPAALRNPSLYKNAAYDVCRSTNANTFFRSWDAIKHNIILNWVDLVDETGACGMALFSDHTTAYTYGDDHPLGLVLGWSWEGGSWWGKCPLRGAQEIAYALVPHAGRWDAAELSRECGRWCEPMLAQVIATPPPAGTQAKDSDAAAAGLDGCPSDSLVRVSGSGIEIPTLLMDGDDLLVRLFNAEGDDSVRRVSLAAKPSRAESVELDGRVVEQLPVRQSPDGRYEVELALPRFGLRTLRFGGLRGANTAQNGSE